MVSINFPWRTWFRLQPPAVAVAAQEAANIAANAERTMRHIEESTKCPITLARMVDPVLATDGYTYDRAAIEEHFKRSDYSPMTNEILESKRLRPNMVLRSILRGPMAERAIIEEDHSLLFETDSSVE